MADQKPLALFPVYLYEHGVELPDNEDYYVVTKNGIFFHKKSQLGSSLTPVKGIPWLEELDVSFQLNMPKIPSLIAAQALTFFRKVFKKYDSESYVTLLYSDKLKQFRLWCPKQTVSRGSVNYDRTDQPSFEDRQQNGWKMVGTIHSHCDFSAFHSGTDEFDESTFDGIHVTFGHVNKAQISIASSIAVNNTRQELEPENTIIGVIRTANKPQVKKKYMSWGDTYYFDIELSEADAQQLVLDTEMIEEEWMPKVTKLQPPTGFYTGGSKKFNVHDDDFYNPNSAWNQGDF